MSRLKILIVDGNNIASRSFHKLDLSYNGFDTSALYGFLRSLARYVDSVKPDSCFVCWDGGNSARRKTLFPGYKANRKKKFEKLAPWEKERYEHYYRELHVLRKRLPFLGVHQLFAEGVEADDWIANLVFFLRVRVRAKCIILSGDKDMYQLVGDGVLVLNPADDSILTIKNFERVVGMRPEQWLDYRAMTGDKSDDIPGVRLIGDVSARKIIRRYEFVDFCLENGERGMDRVAKRVVEGLDIVKRNLELMSLSAALDKGMRKSIGREWKTEIGLNEEGMRKFFTGFGMRDFLSDMLSFMTPFRAMLGRGKRAGL